MRLSKPIADTERLHVVLTIGHPARMLAGFIRLLKESWFELRSHAGIGRIASCEARLNQMGWQNASF